MGQRGFQKDQRHLMLKVSLKTSTQDHIWSQKEGVSGTKHCMEYIHFMFHFTTFQDVSIYVKCSQNLVMYPVFMIFKT